MSDLDFCKSALKKAIRQALKAGDRADMLALSEGFLRITSIPAQSQLEKLQKEVLDLKNEFSFLKSQILGSQDNGQVGTGRIWGQM